MKDTVLIVGDDANARLIASTLTRVRNAHVLRITDPTRACDVMCCEGAAVVVLDLTYTGMKGLEMLRRLRGRFDTAILPTQPHIIVVADWVESAVERLAVGLGASAFLRKPVTAHDLFAVFDNLGVATPARGTALAAPAPAPSSADAAAWLGA